MSLGKCKNDMYALLHYCVDIMLHWKSSVLSPPILDFWDLVY